MCCLLEMVVLAVQHRVPWAIVHWGPPWTEFSVGTTLPPACPGHGHSGIPPRTFYCLQQVTPPRSRRPPWFSPFSLFIEKFMSCLIFRPQWISSGRRGWESDTLPIPFVSCCLFRWGGSFSLKEGEHWVREDSCGPSDQTGKCHSIVTLAPPAFELTHSRGHSAPRCHVVSIPTLRPSSGHPDLCGQGPTR